LAHLDVIPDELDFDLWNEEYVCKLNSNAETDGIYTITNQPEKLTQVLRVRKTILDFAHHIKNPEHLYAFLRQSMYGDHTQKVWTKHTAQMWKYALPPAHPSFLEI